MAKKIKDEYEILTIFKKIHRDESVLWLWQNKGVENRIVHFGYVKFFDMGKRTLNLKPKNPIKSKTFSFKIEKDLYFYSRDEELAGKVKIINKYEGGIIVVLPEFLNPINGEEFSLFETDDDELYKDQRAAPRGKSKDRRIVTIVTEESVAGKKDDLFVLYDLSKGGLSFNIDDPSEFKVGEVITFTAIDGKPIPAPIHGVIVAIRTIKDMNMQIKACVKFD